MRVRSATIGCPPMSLPRASASGESQLVVGLGADDLPEGHQLAFLVRRSRGPSPILPGITSTTRTLMHRQRARQVLRQRGDLACLDPRGRPQLEARHHRPGLHRHHLGLDAEVLAASAPPAATSPRAPRPSTSGSRGGGSSSSFSGGSSRRLGRIEQRHLPLVLDALALRRPRAARGSMRGGAAQRRLLLLSVCDRLAALLAPLAPLGGIAWRESERACAASRSAAQARRRAGP